MRLFKVFFPTRVVALLFSEIALIFGCYVVASIFATEIPNLFLTEDAGLYRIALVTACIVGGFYLNDLYSQLRLRSRSQLMQQVCFVLGIAFLIQSLLDYLRLPDWSLPKWTMIYGSILVLLVQPTWRVIYDRLVMSQLARETVLFVGASSVARMVGERLAESPQFGQSVAGYLEDSPASDEIPRNLLLGPISQVREIVESLKPQRIIVGMTERRGRLPVHDLLELRFSGIHIEEAQAAYETVFGRVSVKDLRPSQLIFMADLGPRPQSESLQGIYSFAIALIGFLVTLPIMLIVALLVRLTSRGPVLYRQVRAGKNGARFTLFKFRSMHQDAEAKSGAVWASKNDPRVTPLGRWLRKLRLDELPQLINVLRREMVIVGPRPERPEFVKVLTEQIPYYQQRLAVKPGITGWAQINHKYGDTIEDTLLKLEYDLYYIKNLNMTLDLYIMFQTAKVMLLSRGAQ
ncbi:MAG TPA: sugar transferase [Bryobacteraceae bacterium]|jgi:sugar transferase (PEP-CTERM system associated)|nr:sugar transferase [Bryobacteraceae bacterium]